MATVFQPHSRTKVGLLTLLGGLFLLVGGVAAGGVALYLYLDTKTFLKHAHQATGTVTELRRGSGSDCTTPVVEFTGDDGKVHAFSGSVCSKPPAFARGERVTGFQEPGHPERAKLDEFMALWMLPLILGIVGVVVLLAGNALAIIGFFVLRKAKKGAPASVRSGYL